MFVRVEEKDFTYGLDYGAILLLATIRSLSESTDGCFASNQYFAQKFNCSDRTIKRWLKDLKDRNLIQILYTGQQREIGL